MSTKICSKCGVEKELTEFHNCKRSKDGFLYQCKLCRNSQVHNSCVKRSVIKSIYRSRYANVNELGNGIDTIYLKNGDMAFVDESDYNELINYMWRSDKDGYAIGCINSKTVRMHRYITNCKIGEIIDHIDGNKLNNKRSNLRICSQMQNAQHRTVLSSKNKSGKTGVSFNDTVKKWCARIGFNNVSIGLGYYEDINDAIEARRLAEDKYFGEYKTHI